MWKDWEFGGEESWFSLLKLSQNIILHLIKTSFLDKILVKYISIP